MLRGGSSADHDEVLNARPDTAQLAGLLKALGDPIRLRILGVLARHELSVGELGRTLGLSQSRVSNHLRVIRDYELLAERHVGPSTFLRLELDSRSKQDGFVARLWSALRPELEALREHADDLTRLRVVLDERHKNSRDFFDRVAGEWDAIGVDFASGQARQRVVANFIAPGLAIADLGCGTGYVAAAFLGLCERVICVDASSGMLAEARKRLEASDRATRVECRIGELDALPIDDAEVDGALCAMVLHHLSDPDACLAEMFRIIRPGGTGVVLELAPHREAWMHDQLGDRHLGLDSAFVAARFERAGFEDVTLEVLDDSYQPKAHEGASADVDSVLNDDVLKGTVHESQGREGPALSLYLIRGRVPRSA